LKGTHTSLYHNNGDGSFSDVSEKSGVAKTESYYCFTALTGDFDGDGWLDIYVSCDPTPSMLFHNNRNGTFSETAVAAGVALNETGASKLAWVPMPWIMMARDGWRSSRPTRS
jgi:hypothetical protein